MTTYKIDHKTAKWLHAATRKTHNPVNDSMFCVHISDNRYGHVAAVTDGYRLHVVEVSRDIPSGLYDLDKNSGELTQAPLDDKGKGFPDYLAYIPIEFLGEVDSYDPTALQHQSWTPKVTFTLMTDLHVCPLTSVQISYKFIKQAVPEGLTPTFKLQSPRRPIVVELVGKAKRKQFAVIMPT